MINSTEDAQIYLDKVCKHLIELRKLSLDAKLCAQASIWLTIEAAFRTSTDEVKTIEDIMHMYNEAKLVQLESEIEMQ